MGDQSAIQWTDATWNPVTGCSKVSPGCAHCYAERVAIRLWPSQYPPVACDPNDPRTAARDTKRIELLGATGVPGLRFREFTDVQCHEDRLDQPLRWKRPRKVFVNSMSDLFHEDVPDYFIARVFSVMAWARQHTFQILTKRHERMRALVSSAEFRAEVAEFVDFWLHDDPEPPPALRWDPNERRTDDARATVPDIDGDDWPLPNVWLGVSVENQHFADERIPLLLQTPAAIRFISAEPLLGLVDVGDYLDPLCECETRETLHSGDQHDESCPAGDGRLDWVIVGGESGRGARPFDVAWASAIVSQCQAARVPVFVKQLGANPYDMSGMTTCASSAADPLYCVRCKVRAVSWPLHVGRIETSARSGGDPEEWPEDLRVREMPTTEARS